jgi:hypothetical protein
MIYSGEQDTARVAKVIFKYGLAAPFPAFSISGGDLNPPARLITAGCAAADGYHRLAVSRKFQQWSSGFQKIPWLTVPGWVDHEQAHRAGADAGGNRCRDFSLREQS